jgi:23S rRNA (uracil1939-C5)-methyltransferase
MGRCSVSSRCGGCSGIDVPYEEQLKAKQSLVVSCIGSYGPVENIIRMKNPDHYRNKVTSVFALDRKHKPACGIYAKGTHEVIPVSGCLIEDPKGSAVIQAVMSLLPSFRIRVYDEDTGTGTLRYVQVRTARATGQIMVTLVTADAVFPSKNNFVTALRRLQPKITTIVQNINRRTDSMVLGDREHVLFGPGYIEDRLCGKTFRISSSSFYQVNPIQTEKLYHIAIDDAGLSGKENVLDAYCGIGTIGICASDRAAHVTAVEINPDAVRNASENARLNKAANVTVCEGDAGEYLQDVVQERGAFDVIFLDPPRAGASEAFLQAAAAASPKKIVYVSCDPVTLGRDLKFLTANGYRMVKATPVDMFPATVHVETVVLMSRVEGK